jgi:hypothetical protein
LPLHQSSLYILSRRRLLVNTFFYFFFSPVPLVADSFYILT